MAVLRYRYIALVDWSFRQSIVGTHIAKAGVLKEMPAEGVACLFLTFVTETDERTTFDEVVTLIEGGYGKVVVVGMHAKTGKGINGRFRPLPDIADDIVKTAVAVSIDRAGGSAVGKANLRWRQFAPTVVVRQPREIAQTSPLIFAGQTQGDSRLRRFPAAEGRRLVVVDLHWPRPGQGTLLGNQAQAPTRRGTDPESRMLGAGIASPLIALATPPACLTVAAVVDKGAEFAVADQELTGLKGFQLAHVAAVFIVPAVMRVVCGFTQPNPSLGYR